MKKVRSELVLNEFQNLNEPREQKHGDWGGRVERNVIIKGNGSGRFGRQSREANLNQEEACVRLDCEESWNLG